MPFRIIRNDITKVTAEIIVNITNSEPEVRCGTDFAIYRAVGKEGEEKLLRERKKIGKISKGDIKVTKAFNLNAKLKYIIHTVGPIWIDGKHEEFRNLEKCYDKSLKEAEKLKCKSIAFPLIATGMSGFPKDQALEIAVSVFRKFLFEHDMEIILVIYDDKSFQLSNQILNKINKYIESNHRINGFDFRKNQNFFKENLNHVTLSFQKKLLELIHISGMNDKDICRMANIDSKIFNRIKQRKTYYPKKKMVMSLCIGLKLNLEQSKDLLMSAKYEFNSSSKFDLIVQNAIENKEYDILKLNVELQYYTKETLDDIVTLKNIIESNIFTLRGVINEYYELEEKANDKDRFYEDQNRYFGEIIKKCINLREEMDILKKLNNNMYLFDIEGKDFVLTLLKEYPGEGKLAPLRKEEKEIDKLDSEFVCDLYDGFLHIFKAAGADENLIDNVALKLTNSLNVPAKITVQKTKQMAKTLGDMIDDKMSDNDTLGINTLEKYAWILGIQQELEKLIEKWDDLYSIMAELRTEELNNMAEKEAEKIKPEKQMEIELDINYHDKIKQALREDLTLHKLLEEKYKLLGIPIEKLGQNYEYDSMYCKRKNYKNGKYAKNIKKKLEINEKEIDERRSYIRMQVIRKYVADYEPLKETEEEADFSNLIPVGELLNEAIEEQKNKWLLNEKRRREEKGLTEKSFEEIGKEIDESLLAVCWPEEFLEEVKKKIDKLSLVGDLDYFLPDTKSEE